ncbi:MAG: sensor histidine kinase [Verrucomicrobiota bacterium]
MSNALRPLLLALALLILGGMAAFSQLWVHQQSRPAAVEELSGWQTRLRHLAESSAKPMASWQEQDWRDGGHLLGGKLRPLADGETGGTGEIVAIVESEPVLRVAFAPAGGLALETRHALLQQSYLWLLGTAFFSLVLIALVPARRVTHDERHQRELRDEMGNVEHLARTTVSQAEALAQERQARHHSEETLHLQQVLLNRSLEEKIRLGRDLHDGLIQTLYATGLALEGARKQVAVDPARATALIERCIGTLNTAIQEVRHEIESLAPAQVRRGNFKSAIEAILNLIDAGRSAELDVRVPEEIASRIPPEMQTELLQMVRAAVSNALRHGEASRIEIRLETDGERLCLAIRDDGHGFDLEKLKRRGHGLNNLFARAEAIRGELRVDSAPDSGTRIIITFPNDPTLST